MEKYCDTNLNYYIKIKLTEEGRIIYKKHYAKYNCEAPKLNIDDEGYVRFQIHNFINIFGEHLFMGATLPCETNCKIQVKDEWHYVKDGDYPKDNKPVLCILGDVDSDNCEVGYYNNVGSEEPWHFETYHLPDDDGDNAWGVYAWKEIVLPELKESK